MPSFRRIPVQAQIRHLADVRDCYFLGLICYERMLNVLTVCCRLFFYLV
jgi:hypothetical protein